MKSFFAAMVLILGVGLVTPPRASAQDDEIDKKTFKKILQEIELVPSLYTKDEPTVNLKRQIKTLPKFSSLKIVSFPIGKINTPDKELEKWKADKTQYTRDYPHRAFVLTAAEMLETVKPALTLPGPIDPKSKQAFLMEQMTIGKTIYDLEKLVSEVEKADRGKEKVRRWLLDSDFARARVLGNLVFLYEYNFTLGQIRADNLPDLGMGDNCWKIAFRPMTNVREPQMRAQIKVRAEILASIQKEAPGTPWAYFAEKESQRPLGMTWVAAKK